MLPKSRPESAIMARGAIFLLIAYGLSMCGVAIVGLLQGNDGGVAWRYLSAAMAPAGPVALLFVWLKCRPSIGEK